MMAADRLLSESTTATTDAASASSINPTCGRPRFMETGSLNLASARMPSDMRSEEIVEIVEWLRAK
jgi:hypothetical protein